jgi:hypothetical protein
MFDWIPLESYTFIYYYVMLVVVVITFQKLRVLGLDSIESMEYGRNMGMFALFFVVLYIGLRPISWYFVDMSTYASFFQSYQEGNSILLSKDLLFEYFMQACAQIMDVNSFFLVCAFLYITPLYMVCKKWFSDNWFLAFLLLIVSFSFWSYGTNGIRNGMATSFFLLGISREKRFYQIIWLVMAVNFHSSMLLPSFGFILVQFYNNPKTYLAFWLLCIPLSLALGGFWESLIASLGFQDERISFLTDGNINDDEFAYTGFRWDFLLYSATGVFAGWYYIVKKDFSDPIYFKLFNIYLLANGFWVLVIRANFSNRFAYLSWFMLALIIVYPLLKKEILEEDQNRKLSWILLAYFGFTFFMNVILSK